MSTPDFAPPPPSPSGGMKIPLLAGAVIALLLADVYLFMRLDGLARDLNKFRSTTMTELTSLREASSVTTATSRRSIDSLRQELEAARRQVVVAVGQAKTEAVARAESLARQLDEEQKRYQQQVAGQISEVRQAAGETAARVGQVSSDVSTVKTDVAATKAELNKTIADLKRVTGDMGVMSGLIATNSKELSALKDLGDRTYVPFDLKKAKRPQKVGDIGVLLKKADPKNYRFSIDLIADDKTTHKDDRTINEPLQFYTSKARQPYELVVNEVRKDQIVGYLAVPKVQVGR